MKNKLLFTTLFAFIISEASAQLKPITGQYIVILKESAATPVIKKQKKNNNREQKFNDNKPERDKNLAKLKEVRQKKNIKESSVLLEYADVTVGFSAKLTGKEKKDLEDDPEVEGVYQDYYLEQEPEITGPDIESINTPPPDLTTFQSKQYQGCNINVAGGPATTTPRSTCIWILDTGIDTDHPDLNAESNPRIARSFVPNQTIEDGRGHGTHCAGIAAAKNNSFGVVGVSPGASVVPIKILPNVGDGEWSWMLAGLNHVAMFDVPGDVVSMSVGTKSPIPGTCATFFPMINNAVKALGNEGTWVVIAAGNFSGDANVSFPACVNGPRVITVGSIDCNNICSSFSNFNPDVVDWVAIGSNVFSTDKNGGYTIKSGTSMATPLVAGIIHSKNGLPASGGRILCKNYTYKIAVR